MGAVTSIAVALGVRLMCAGPAFTVDLMFFMACGAQWPGFLYQQGPGLGSMGIVALEAIALLKRTVGMFGHIF